MCGIAGIMSTDGKAPAISVLERMTAALRHRGPDGSGRHVKGGVGLIQTRLAIIDLATGDQPLFAASTEGGADDLALVANGEIYNYVELRERMNETPFRTGSDCEPPLHLYLRHGIDFAEHLRGMFTIAIHDMRDDSLVLARDPFGIKPLYYGLTDDGFAFASEPAALIAAGITKAALAPAKLDELLALQFTTGAETPFQGIYRLLPGETIVVRDGRIGERVRLAALPPGGHGVISKMEALQRFDRVFTDAVNVHQRSDVPYGMFLSGGIDSTALLAVMRRLNPTPVEAFTAWFPNTGAADERDQARTVAAAVGARHHEIEVTEADFWRQLPTIAAAMDDPAADYAVLPTYMLAGAAKAAGLKVVLSGEGGDELFGGYGRYRRARRWKILGGRKMRSRPILAGLGVLRRESENWRDGIEAAERDAKGYGRTALQEAQAVDCADWLPNDLLTKLDRCLMAHGVEGRVPFLDPFVATFAYALPDGLKVRHGQGKWLLRKWLETALPVARAFSRKQGFTVPVGDWIAGRGASVGELVANQPGIAEVCHPDVVRALFKAGKDLGKAQWTLLFYALWHNRHILGRAADGAVEDMLSA